MRGGEVYELKDRSLAVLALAQARCRRGRKWRRRSRLRDALGAASRGNAAVAMKIPATTYRLQFTPQFGFAEADAVLDYLRELGITDIYASPIFHARSGSMHGYDVVDPNRLNPELGSEAEFEALVERARRSRLGWLQDIVPNHMAYDSQNRMLMDVLENGQASTFADFFDIDWNHPYENMKGKILAPFLGGFYGECLEKGEITLQLRPGRP